MLGAAWEEGTEVWVDEEEEAAAETAATLPVVVVLALFGPLEEALGAARPAVAAERFGAILNRREELRMRFWWYKIKLVGQETRLRAQRR